MQLYPPNFIYEGRNFQETWQEAVRFCLKNGMLIKAEENSKVMTYDICSKITLHGNAIKQILARELHPKFPTKGKHCETYTQEYNRDWVAKQNTLPEGDNRKFVYNYMDRIINYPCFNEPGWKLDQIEKLINMLKIGISRRCQAITWIPEKDIYSESPPCLQRIWIRILNDEGDCEIHFDWRSRDLFGAWMTNYIGLFDMLDREILTPLNLNVVKMVCNCNSLHIYESDWKAASEV